MLRVEEVNFNRIGEKQWSALVRQSRCASFFQTYAWIKLWLIHFERTIEKTLILAVYDDNTLIGIGPFAIKNQAIEFITLTEVEEQQTLSDYGDIVAVANKEDIIWQAILAQLLQLKKEHGYTIKFNLVCEGSVSYTLLNTIFYGKSEQIEVAPRIALPQDWTVYLSMLTSHARHELKRKMRMSNTEGLRLNRATIDASTINSYTQLIEGVNQQKQQFYSTAMLHFFIDLLHQPGVELFFLYHNTVVIASLILFQYNEDVLAYNSSYDSKYKHFSPGIVLFELAIEHAIQSRKKSFDFLRGCEHYKYGLGALDQRLFCFIDTL